jgi:glycosyltransferase involved in cell wall biosynthesis
VTAGARTRVTVVIPAHDRGDLLRLTLDSVLEQAPQPEIVVVDDASRDDTAELLGAYDVTVVTNRGPAWGAAGARNAGLERVRTAFVAFVDSDDLLLPGALARLAAALDGAREAPFAFGCGLAAHLEPTQGWEPEGLIAPLRSELAAPACCSLYVRNYVPSSGALVRTEQARAAGAYDVERKQTEDLDFWLRLCRLGDPVYVPELVLVYRRHQGNRYGAELALECTNAITGMADADPRLMACRPERLGAVLCEEALEALKRHRLRSVFDAWRRAHGADPDTPRVLRACARHFRRHRRAGALGREVWEGSPELRAWLAVSGSRAELPRPHASRA